jgi:cytoskeletal protein RodZ
VDDANGVPQDETQPPPSGGRKRGATVSPAESAQAEPRTIGEALRRAREDAGLTLAEIAERTKVRPGILAEIEADDHDRLPALTYSLGFVKAYARTVGMDPIAAADRYRLESQKGDPVPTMVDLQPLEAKRLPSGKLVAASLAVLLLLVAVFWAWGAGWLAPAPPAEPEATNATSDSVPAEPEAEEAPAAAAAGTPTAAPVTLTAREEVWLRISDGDETLFMGTMAPGQSMALPPGRAWQLRTGRAGVLDVKVGTVQIPPLGGPAEQVRNLSLKPEDLLARQAAGGTPGLAATPAATAAAAAAPAG